MVLLSLLAIAATGGMSYVLASANLKAEAAAKLTALQEARQEALTRYLGSIREDLRIIATNPMIEDALREFTAAWRELENPTDYLQRQYIEGNPHPTGQKENLDSAADPSTYSRVHARYHPWIRRFLRERGYYDIFLFDPEGNLVYTVFKELDYATNLNTGRWKDTDLGNAFRAAHNSSNGDAHFFFDFEPYGPSHGAPASFISTPILDESGSLMGVLVFQMPIDRIDQVMQVTSGMGESGETYVVGSDMLMRSDSRFSEESTILVTEVDTATVRLALDGGHGDQVTEDYRGIPVLSSYGSLEFLGTTWAVMAEIDEAEILIPVNRMAIWLTLGSLLVVFLSGVLAVLIARTMSRPLEAITACFTEMAAGNDEVALPDLDRRDEIGEMGRALSEFRDIGVGATRSESALRCTSGNIMVVDVDGSIVFANKAMGALIKNLAPHLGGELSGFAGSDAIGQHFEQFHNITELSPAYLASLTNEKKANLRAGGRSLELALNPVFGRTGHRVGLIVQWWDRTERIVMEGEIAALVHAAAQGDFTQRLDEAGKDGFMMELAHGMNQVVETVDRGLSETVKVMSGLAEGDMTRRMEGDYHGTFLQLKRDTNRMAEKIAEIAGNIGESTAAVSGATDEIAAGASDLSSRTEQQASSLEETSASMEELSATVRQNADNAQQANQLAAAARDAAAGGGQVVTSAVEAMSQIEDSSNKITEIVGMIDEIAFQTNLLALNAAVEAARAGEAGKGFAVVATEVRALAQRSGQASKEIKELILTSDGQVREGVGLVKQAGESLDEIVTSVKKVADIVSDIAAASQEQSSGIEEVSSAVTNMDEMTQQNAALVEETTAALHSAQSQVADLNRLVGFFRTGREDGIRGKPAPLAVVAGKAVPKADPISTSDTASARKAASGGAATEDDWQEF